MARVDAAACANRARQRGFVVSEQAVADLLQEGHLAGYAVDVFKLPAAALFAQAGSSSAKAGQDGWSAAVIWANDTWVS